VNRGKNASPLYAASLGGHLRVVEMLLKVLAVLIFRAELALTVLILLAEPALTVLVFLPELALYYTGISF
jgi:hypothetical protein